MDEVREKAPQLRVALYHGPNRARDFSPALLACYDVIVTTYWVLASEFGASPQGSLYRVRWHRCARRCLSPCNISTLFPLQALRHPAFQGT